MSKVIIPETIVALRSVVHLPTSRVKCPTSRSMRPEKGTIWGPQAAYFSRTSSEPMWTLELQRRRQLHLLTLMLSTRLLPLLSLLETYHLNRQRADLYCHISTMTTYATLWSSLLLSVRCFRKYIARTRLHPRAPQVKPSFSTWFSLSRQPASAGPIGKGYQVLILITYGR